MNIDIIINIDIIFFEFFLFFSFLFLDLFLLFVNVLDSEIFEKLSFSILLSLISILKNNNYIFIIFLI